MASRRLASVRISSSLPWPLLRAVLCYDTAAHCQASATDLRSLAGALLAKHREHDDRPRASEEEGDPQGNAAKVEAQLEQVVAEGPRVRHPERCASGGQTIEVEATVPSSAAGNDSSRRCHRLEPITPPSTRPSNAGRSACETFARPSDERFVVVSGRRGSWRGCRSRSCRTRCGSGSWSGPRTLRGRLGSGRASTGATDPGW